jgi:hypothetical protein
MIGTVGELLQSIKSSCDNGTYMYCFKDNNVGKAYHESVLNRPWKARVADMAYFISSYTTNNKPVWKFDEILLRGSIAFDNRQFLHEKIVEIVSQKTETGQEIIRTTETNKDFNYSNEPVNEVVTVEYTYGGISYYEVNPSDGRLGIDENSIEYPPTYREPILTRTRNPSYQKMSRLIPVYVDDSNEEIDQDKSYWEASSFTVYEDEDGYYYNDNNSTFYIKDIMKCAARNPILNIYYKNSNGNWIDYIALTSTYPGINISSSSVQYEERFKVNVNLLPRCKYVDQNQYIYNIDAGDGKDTNATTLTPIEVDTVRGYSVLSKECTFNPSSSFNSLQSFLSFETPPLVPGFTFDHWAEVKDGRELTSTKRNEPVEQGNSFTLWAVYYKKTNVITYEPYSSNPALTFEKRVVFNDIKIVLPENYDRSMFLTWLNGVFVPTTNETLYRNYMFIKDGMDLVESKTINQKIGSVATKTDNATVITDSKDDEYRYDINLHLFSWKNVSVSGFYNVQSSELASITDSNFETVNVLKTMIFPVDVNVDAHFIICNGKVLSKDEYKIDPDNHRRVTLLNVEKETNALLSEISSEINEFSEYYPNVSPIRMLRRLIKNRTYSLINFESKDSTKKIYLRSSNACAINFPYKGEITFTKLNIGDLVLVDGIYSPYLWVHSNTIKFPKSEYTYSDGVVDKLNADNVLRYYFVEEDI